MSAESGWLKKDKMRRPFNIKEYFNWFRPSYFWFVMWLGQVVIHWKR